MLNLRPSQTHIIMTGVSVDLENISVVKVTSGLNSQGTRIVPEHYLFCSKTANGHISIITYLRCDNAIERFYARRNAAWDTKIAIMVPAIERHNRKISIQRR